MNVYWHARVWVCMCVCGRKRKVEIKCIHIYSGRNENVRTPILLKSEIPSFNAQYIKY